MVTPKGFAISILHAPFRLAAAGAPRTISADRANRKESPRSRGLRDGRGTWDFMGEERKELDAGPEVRTRPSLCQGVRCGPSTATLGFGPANRNKRAKNYPTS